MHKTICISMLALSALYNTQTFTLKTDVVGLCLSKTLIKINTPEYYLIIS